MCARMGDDSVFGPCRPVSDPLVQTGYLSLYAPMNTVIATFLLSALGLVATAVPEVVPVPLGTACTSYLGYDGAQAGPFIVVADSTGRDVDGIGLDAHYFVENGHRWGYVTAPASAATSNISMRCADEKLQAQVNLGVEGEDPVWTDVVVSGDPNLEGGLGFAFPDDPYPSIPVGPYWHFVDGKQVPGIFLGARNVTTFGFVDNWAGVEGEYYLLRLMAQGEGFTSWQPSSRDAMGFLKITYA
ncbi:hypothetical protein F4810DRAFT_654842 [Camillea tinctor]|nr:hypothetical protein F4810DRAFT_654842 [Camillea tinctor]